MPVAHATNSVISAHEVVERYDISYQTLNYYTTLGLLKVVKRDGNQRLYRGAAVRRSLREINRLKDEGYPLRLICRKINKS